MKRGVLDNHLDLTNGCFQLHYLSSIGAPLCWTSCQYPAQLVYFTRIQQACMPRAAPRWSRSHTAPHPVIPRPFLSASYIVLLLSNFLGIVLGPHPRFILIRVVLLYFTWYQITRAIMVWSQISLFFSPANMVICMLYNHDFVSHLSIKIINTCVF